MKSYIYVYIILYCLNCIARYSLCDKSLTLTGHIIGAKIDSLYILVQAHSTVYIIIAEGTYVYMLIPWL